MRVFDSRSVRPIAVAFFAALFVVAPQLASGEEESKATVKETVDWLNGKSGWLTRNITADQYAFWTDVTYSEGCTLEFTEKMKKTSSGGSGNVRISGRLDVKKLNPAGVVAGSRDGFKTVEFAAPLNAYTSCTGSRKWCSKDPFHVKLYLSPKALGDSATSEAGKRQKRLTKALQHFVAKCSGTSAEQPF